MIFSLHTSEAIKRQLDRNSLHTESFLTRLLSWSRANMYHASGKNVRNRHLPRNLRESHLALKEALDLPHLRLKETAKLQVFRGRFPA